MSVTIQRPVELECGHMVLWSVAPAPRDVVWCLRCSAAAVVATVPTTIRPSCGTATGEKLHRRAREMPCEPCRIACNEYQRHRFGQRRRQS